MKTVFILGAGASKQAGGPLMADFLDKAYELERLYGSRLGNSRDAFNLVTDVIRDLQGIHIKSYLDLDNIEILFGAIEMGQLLGKIGTKTRGISQVYESIVTLIVKTLENSIEFPYESGMRPPPPYSEFLGVVEEIGTWASSRSSEQPFSFITFNYDIAIDYAFQYYSWRPDYSLAPESEGHYPLLKLHGSLNWKKCRNCRKIVSVPVLARVTAPVPGHRNRQYIPISDNFTFCPICKQPINELSFIVPPTWNKTSYQTTLQRVWRRAVRELEEAENIIVIGYSLPDTDQFFRYLFAIGSQSEINIKRFWVFNPDESGATEQRFRELTGRSIEKRFKYFPMTFEFAIDVLRKNLRTLVID